MEPPEAHDINVIRLRDLSHQFYNAYAVKPFMQLGRAEIMVDLSSSLPLDELFSAGAFVVSSDAEGLYDPGRYTSGRGSLISLGGRIIEHEQGPREVGFARYEIGFMRGDKFISVRRTSLVQDQQNLES